MHSKELEEIRRLFELAEIERDPERKFSFVEDALDLLDDFSAERPADSHELTVANNLRHSNLHLLLGQLSSMPNIEFSAWFNYIKLFLSRAEPDVKAILSSDPSLRSAYRKFVGLWRDDLIAALESAK